METLVSILAILGLVVAVVIAAILILTLWDRLLTGRKLSPDEQLAAARELDSRLVHPRFDELETHFGTAVPDELRSLYQRTDILLKRNSCFSQPNTEDDENAVQHFLPADEQTLHEVWFDVGKGNFPFAIDDFGNYYFIQMGVKEGDRRPVLYIDHDGGDVWEVADSLTTFLKWRVCDENGNAS